MQSFQLPINRSLLDANFEGYKVSMDNIHFVGTKMEQNSSYRSPTSQMVTLQHMKVFSNDNQLFCDSTKSSDSQEYLYRILETGHIQSLVHDKNTRQWETEIVGSISLGDDENCFPPNLLFTENDLAVACNGVNEIFIFRTSSHSKFSSLLKYTVSEDIGLVLIEARVFDNELHILAYQIETGDEKKTQSRIYYLTVKCGENEMAEVKNSTEFVQPGHFETCTFSNDGYIIFLSSEAPKIVGVEHSSIKPEIKHSWEQIGNIIQVTFNLENKISEKDVNIDVTKKGIRLTVNESKLLSGSLGGEIDENDVEICADQKTNTLVLKLTSTSDQKWEKLIAVESDTLEELEEEEIKKMAQEFGTDEPTEECDEADGSLGFFWFNRTSQKIEKHCDVSGSQVLFIQRDCSRPSSICLRHDVDGILWTFNESIPFHSSTLQAFGYVQASKTTRIWSGCSPNAKLACIAEGNNRFLLYSQKVEVFGSLSNRKTSTKVQHVSKQHLLRVENTDVVRGVHLTDNHLYAATKNTIYVAELTF